MSKYSLLFKKTVLIALVVSLALSAFSVTNVSAAGLNDQADPPTDVTQQSAERLERVWMRLQKAYERQGKILDRADVMTEKIQALIDKMEEKDKDVVALQAALATFEDAIKDAHPVYESAKGIINSHKGFDSDGTVTDREQALETVKNLGGKLKEVRGIAGEPGKALREAIKAYREENRPADTSGPLG